MEALPAPLAFCAKAGAHGVNSVSSPQKYFHFKAFKRKGATVACIKILLLTYDFVYSPTGKEYFCCIHFWPEFFLSGFVPQCPPRHKCVKLRSVLGIPQGQKDF